MKNEKISKKIFENIIIAVIMLLYFILINFAYLKIDRDIFFLGLKILSMVIMASSIVIFEVAYKKDSGKLAINGIEVLILSIITLSIGHFVELTKLSFDKCIVLIAFIFSIYYLLKAIIVYTREKREYLKSLSDIKEIVSNDPTKKVAEKRKNKTKKK